MYFGCAAICLGALDPAYSALAEPDKSQTQGAFRTASKNCGIPHSHSDHAVLPVQFRKQSVFVYFSWEYTDSEWAHII